MLLLVINNILIVKQTYDVNDANEAGAEFDLQRLRAVLDRTHIFVVEIPTRCRVLRVKSHWQKTAIQ